VAVVALLAAFLLTSGDEAGADEIFLEPVDFEGEDPFTDSVATDDGEALGELVADDGAEVDGSANGSEPGLYGGSLNTRVCDREQLVDFLGDEAAKANAFAEVLGIDVDDIPSYVASLTPVILRGDTRVTNHGYRDGEPTSFQAVLQAGTAVLVDAQGIPRVKCYCGNPLTPPVEVEGPRYGGDRWDDFDEDDVTVIFVDVDIDIFILTDVVDGGTFGRPTGSDGDDDQATDDGGDLPPDDTLPPPDTALPLGTGDVQVTLTWASGDDLDLHVIDPAGQEIYYGSRSSSSGGELDTDDTAGCGTSGSHVENVFWPTGGAPPGTYEAFVVAFNGCGAPASYTLEVRVGGDLLDSRSGTLVDDQESDRIVFTVS
jgi:hypothetical protein